MELLVPYAEDVTRDMIAYFENNDFTVNSARTFGIRSGLEMGLVESDPILQATSHISDSGATLHVGPVFNQISESQNRPVVSSNQALSWHPLRLAGLRDTIPNVGAYLQDKLI